MKAVWYPVHFEQHTGFSFMVSEVSVRQAGAETQERPPEAARFLQHSFPFLPQGVLSWRTVRVPLLLCVIIS